MQTIYTHRCSLSDFYRLQSSVIVQVLREQLYYILYDLYSLQAQLANILLKLVSILKAEGALAAVSSHSALAPSPVVGLYRR